MSIKSCDVNHIFKFLIFSSSKPRITLPWEILSAIILDSIQNAGTYRYKTGDMIGWLIGKTSTAIIYSIANDFFKFLIFSSSEPRIRSLQHICLMLVSIFGQHIFIQIISVSEIQDWTEQSISETVTEVLVRKIIRKIELGSIELVDCRSFQITDPFWFWNDFFKLFFIHKLDDSEHIVSQWKSLNEIISRFF